MEKDKVEKVEAYIERKSGKVKVHINSLTLEIVVEDSNPGPLGWKPNQKPGIIFWKSEYIKKHDRFFEHGTQRPLIKKRLTKKTAKSFISALNMGEEH